MYSMYDEFKTAKAPGQLPIQFCVAIICII
jgi:hypothetical protein